MFKQLLIIIFIMFLPFQIFSKSELIIVKGMMDIGKGPHPAEKGFEKWIGAGGRVHLNNLTSKGLMSYSIDGKEVLRVNKMSWALTIMDSRNNGMIVGTFENFPERKEEVLWVGHFKIEGNNGFTHGFLWGVGKNKNEGKIIELTFDEDERNYSKNSKNPNIYFINGFITDQPKEPL